MSLHSDIGAGFAFLIEVSITYPFIMTVFASTDPSRGFVGFQAPLAIGLSVTVGLLMAVCTLIFYFLSIAFDKKNYAMCTFRFKS